MKKFLPQLALIAGIISILLSSCNSPFGKSGELSEKQVLKASCYTKVWGFLKYYHPGLANGQIDWDSVYVDLLPKVLLSNDKEFELYMDNLIDLPGEIQQCESCKSIYDHPKEWTRNLNLEWITEHPLLSNNQIEDLKNILDNRHQGKGFYVEYQWGDGSQSGPVKFINENSYSDSLVIADYRYRILALARYWNSAEYFFAYKYLLSKDWNTVLMDYIPILFNESSLLNYHLNIYRLAREIEDSHSGGTYSRYLFENYWDKKVPFDLRTIGGKTIVSEITSKTLNSSNDIRVGDEIVLIDSIPVGDAIMSLRPYCLSSNKPTTNSATDNHLLIGHSDKLTLSILRSGNSKEVKVDRFPIKTFWTLETEKDPIATIYDNFVFIKLGMVESKAQIDSIMELAKEKPYIVFDLRDYPMFNAYDLEAHFVSESRHGFRAYEPSLDDIGVFKPSLLESQQLEVRDLYQGNVIVLVNEYTQSYAESIAMFFQTLPQSIIVGSQTAGANGNTVRVPLPGSIRASFSNIIIEYPDGNQFQKNGIRINLPVELSIEDIISKRDPYIDLARKIVNNHSL